MKIFSKSYYEHYIFMLSKILAVVCIFLFSITCTEAKSTEAKSTKVKTGGSIFDAIGTRFGCERHDEIRNVNCVLDAIEKSGRSVGCGIALESAVVRESKAYSEICNFKGSVVVVMFTADWCPSCPAVLNKLMSFSKLMTGNDVKIIIVHIGGKLHKKNVIDSNSNNLNLNDVVKLPKKNIIDSNSNNLNLNEVVTELYISSSEVGCDIKGIPAIVFFDRGLNPVCSFVGGSVSEFDHFLDLIDAIKAIDASEK